MSFDEVAGKFRQCAEYAGFGADAAERVVATVRALETLGDVRELTGLLTI